MSKYHMPEGTYSPKTEEAESKRPKAKFTPPTVDRPKVRIKVPDDVLAELYSPDASIWDAKRNWGIYGGWAYHCPPEGNGVRLWVIIAPDGYEVPPQLQGKWSGREAARKALVAFLEGNPHLKNPEQPDGDA